MIWSMVFIENRAAIMRPNSYGWCLAKMVRGGHIIAKGEATPTATLNASKTAPLQVDC
jgi:hypothetical protein